MKKLVLETTSPFQGLPELVAFNEGLFEQEGLTVEWTAEAWPDRGGQGTARLPWQCLYLLPEPHGHGSFRPIVRPLAN